MSSDVAPSGGDGNAGYNDPFLASGSEDDDQEFHRSGMASDIEIFRLPSASSASDEPPSFQRENSLSGFDMTSVPCPMSLQSTEMKGIFPVLISNAPGAAATGYHDESNSMKATDGEQ